MSDQGTSVATSPRPSTKPAASHAVRYVVMALIVVVAGGLSYYAWDKSRASASAAEPKGKDDQAPAGLSVDVVHPTKGGIERTTEQAGSVHAFEHASLYAKVSGYLNVQTVDIGDKVKKGQLLAVIDDPEVDKAVEQNVASLDQSKARVKVAEAKVRSAEAMKQAAEATVKQEEADVSAKTSNVDLQRKALARVKDLLALDSIDAKLVDEQIDRSDVANSELGVARATVLTAKAQVISKAALIEESHADLAEAQANVEIAVANLARARVMQDYTRISSPYDGVVSARSFHIGDFVRSAVEGGNMPVLAVARTDKMRVVLPVPDKSVPYVNRGDPAVVRMDALPGEEFSGTVSRFAETEDPESRNMRTEVDLPNADGKLVEGMYGRVTLILQAPSPNALTIPSSGLIGQSAKGVGSVYVVKDGKARKVEVKVSKDTGIHAEIVGGLSVDDQVITRYNGSIGDGTPVAPHAPQSSQAGH